jgi:DNA modification methylase
MNEINKQGVKMTYYQRVKLFRDNQQVLLDEFLAEVVATGIITKTKENNSTNRNKVYFQFISNKLNKKTVNSFKDHIVKLEEKLAKANNENQKELYKSIILETQYNVRFWNIAKPLYNADRKLEQIKYFAGK